MIKNNIGNVVTDQVSMKHVPLCSAKAHWKMVIDCCLFCRFFLVPLPLNEFIRY